MLLTESEGKELLALHGVTTAPGVLIQSPDEFAKLSLDFPVAVKAQVASGGRGKAGGVRKVDDEEQARAAVFEMFGQEFGGERPRALLLEPWLKIKRELYLSVTVDGRSAGYVVLYSPSGGVEVESGTPPARYEIGAPEKFRAHHLREVLREVEPDAKLREQVIAVAARLLEIAVARDCLTVEINPLAQLENNSLLAADAKVVRDDSAAFRAADIREALEAERRKLPEPLGHALADDLILVWLDGDVGLISGGAGMTMAAMDAISAAGGRPACFLDCSANPTPKGYRRAFDLLDSQPNVKTILVSIFGGATQMDRVARVMKDIAVQRSSLKPVVFRLNGTNAESIGAVFADAGLRNHETLEGAVAEAVRLAGVTA